MLKALFLDRDGVINIEKEYLYKIEDFEFMDGILDLCRHYQSLDYYIIVVTNQSGIARKYYTEDDFTHLNSWMIEAFKKEGISISKVYYCPHHPSISGECSCRKPKPGMLLEAQKEFSVDFANCIMIGDKERDIQSAIAVSIEETYLLDTTMQIQNSQATKIVSHLDAIWK